MSSNRTLLAIAMLAMTSAAPVLAQTAPAIAAADSTVNRSSPIPDLSGMWNHPAFPWYEPPASGPGPVTNKSRWPRIFGSLEAGTLALPPLKEGDGISDYDQLVGDYTNPILQPWAAEIVKKFGEMSLAGVTYGNPSNQCWPEPPPFIYKQALVLILQQPDTITMVYSGNMDVRRVRMNQPHMKTPALYGDSVGHYEGGTLVIDTVGIRTDRPYAMIDLFGTPYTKALHMVERYRLRDYDDVKEAIERNKKENWLFAGDVYSRHRGKFLQLELTIEDEGVFTTPWTSTLTYVPGPETWPEVVCAENTHQFYYDRSDTNAPRAEKPDF
jgi:hypothetical protein